MLPTGPLINARGLPATPQAELPEGRPGAAATHARDQGPQFSSARPQPGPEPRCPHSDGLWPLGSEGWAEGGAQAPSSPGLRRPPDPAAPRHRDPGRRELPGGPTERPRPMPDALKSPSPTAPDPAPGRAAPSEAAPASPQPLRLYEPPEGAVAALAAPRTHLEGRVLLHLQGHGQLGRRLLHRHLGPAERRRRVRRTPGSDVRRAGGGGGGAAVRLHQSCPRASRAEEVPGQSPSAGSTNRRQL